MYTMNKIYKVIWSKVKACYVVVSELAKRHSKCKSAKPAISLAALVTAFMLTAGHGVVYATDLAPTDNVGKIGAITIDSSKVDDSKFRRIVNIDGFIIDNSVQNYGTFSQYMQNIYGRYNQVGTNRSDTLLGLDGGNTALGCLTLAGIELERNEIKDADGNVINVTYATELAPTGGARFKKADGHKDYGYATALGFATAAAKTNAIATGHYTVADGLNAFSGGSASMATNDNAFAFGRGVLAAGANSFAFGEGWRRNPSEEPELIASGKNSVAMGDSTKAFGKNSVALGHSTKASGQDSVALNGWTEAKGDASLAAGNSSKALADNSTALSGGLVSADAKNAAAIGKGASAQLADSVALGSKSIADRAGFTRGYNPKSGAVYASDAEIATVLGKSSELETLNTTIDAQQATYNEKKAAYDAAKAAYYNNQDGTLSGQLYDAWSQAATELNEATRQLNASQEEKRTMLASWKSGVAAVSVGDASTGRTRQITGVAAGAEDTDAVNVAQLKALNQKVDDGAVHYYSVKSDQQGAGTNYANDGAKAADSMVIGISSSTSEKAKNSTVLGNNNTLANQPNARGVERDSENNSIVVGQNLTVEGARNAVFGTDYQNGTDKLLTHVAGERNTVIGVGNLVGYTAERVGTEWKYTKFKNFGDDGNVVVGLKNTVNGGGVVVGTNTTVSAYGGVAFGHHNTVSGDEDKGVALGNDLNVSGYGALAVGTESAATGDYTIALGVESKAQALMAASMGYDSQAKASGSVALGAWSSAEAKQALALGYDSQAKASGSVALGAKSVANRGKDVLGYDPVTGAAFANDAAVAAALGKTAELTAAETNIANAQTAVTAAQQAYDADQSEDNERALRDAKKALAQAENAKGVLLSTYKSTLAAVSVGDASTGQTRQITGVAAGTKETDAVNVAQLKAAKTHYVSVKNDGHDDSAAPAGTNWNNDGAKDLGGIAIGQNAVAQGEHEHVNDLGSVAIGQNALAQNGAIAIGKDARIFDQNKGDAIAIGRGAQAAQGGIVIGRDTKDHVVNDDGSVGARAFGVFVGHQIKTLGGSAQTALGSYAQVKGQGATAVGDSSHALESDSTAVGGWAKATAVSSTAVGKDSFAEADRSTALGAYANGRGHNSVSVGEASVAAGHNSIAIGMQSFAYDGSFIDGEEYENLSEEEKTKYFEAQGIDAYFLKDPADGADSKKIADTYVNTAVGSYSKAKKHGSAFGGFSKANGEESLASGYTSNAAEKRAAAIGPWAQAAKENSTALGFWARSNVKNGVALGAISVADRDKDVLGYDPVTGTKFADDAAAAAALGKTDELTAAEMNIANAQTAVTAAQQAYDADQSDANKTALDNAKNALAQVESAKGALLSTYKSTMAAVSVGDASTGQTRQITNLAAGSEDTDAVNVAQLKALSGKVDEGAVHYFSVAADDSAKPENTNWNNDGATGAKAIAIGRGAKANGNHSIALGSDGAEFSAPKTTGAAAIAIGSGAEAGVQDISIGLGAKATGGFGVAIGRQSEAKASTAVAMAYGAKAEGANSLAIGILSDAKTDDSAAYGREANALGAVSLAVGMRSKAGADHTAVFGAEATTDATAWNGTAIGRSAYIGKQAPDGTTPNIGVSNNYFTPVDDDTAVAPGKETMNSTAVGFGAKAFGYQDTALGAGAEAFDTNTVSIGVMSKAIGHYANALGKQARAEGKDSVAIGHWARSIGESSMALGDYAITSTLDGTTSVTKSAAIGSHARAASDNSVALGANSLANIADDVATKAYLSNEAFAKENGVVSVGNEKYKVGDTTVAKNYRRITNVAGGAADNDAVNVAQLKALSGKVDEGAVHYYSVKSNQQAAGTNYANDGAKAADSMVIGISSSTSEKAKNSTVLGNNNTLANQPNARGVERDSENNSIVVGQNLTVEGARNAVFGTDYQNGTDKLLTHVAGERNTVIGVGNLVGYTAERVGTEWKYTKFKGHGDDENVVVGLTNTVNGGGVVVGTNTTVSAYGGVAFGHHNIVSGDEDKGVALGNDLNVSGYGALAVGTESTATGDYTIALGVESKAQSNQAASMGYQSRAKASESVALGAWSNAEAKQAVALGAMSVADRAEKVAGYDPATKAASTENGKEWKSTLAAVSVGNAKETRQITGVAAGSEDTDAVNVAQLKALNKQVTEGAVHYFSVKADDSANPVGTNWNNDGAKSTGSIAVGQKARTLELEVEPWKTPEKISSDHAVALGSDASAAGNGSVAIGKNAVTGTRFATESLGGGASLTTAHNIAGDGAVAVGDSSQAGTEGSVAIGRKAQRGTTGRC